MGKIYKTKFAPYNFVVFPEQICLTRNGKIVGVILDKPMGDETNYVVSQALKEINACENLEEADDLVNSVCLL